MRVSRLIVLAVSGLLLTAVPAGAAQSLARPAVAVDAVRVTQLSLGSRLHVHISGVLDRVFWSKDQIASALLADVDDDGDLDLLAATIRNGLLVWRNTARGFELAHGVRPGPRRTTPHAGVRASEDAGRGTFVGDEHRDPPGLAPATALVVTPLTAATERPLPELGRTAPSPIHQGRAPPAAA